MRNVHARMDFSHILIQLSVTYSTIASTTMLSRSRAQPVYISMNTVEHAFGHQALVVKAAKRMEVKRLDKS